MKEGDLILVSAEATGLGKPMEAIIDKIETFMGQTLVTVIRHCIFIIDSILGKQKKLFQELVVNSLTLHIKVRELTSPNTSGMYM